MATALAKAGQYQRAQILANSIVVGGWQARALAQVAGALAEAGQYQRAEALACLIKVPSGRADALAHVAEALARAGRREQAEAVAANAGSTVDSITDSVAQARALARIAGALAQQISTLKRRPSPPVPRTLPARSPIRTGRSAL